MGLFRRLRRWLSGRRSTDIFGPYWNGEANVYADPLAIKRQLTLALGGNPRAWLERFYGDDPTIAMQSAKRIFAAVRQAFGMVPFDPATGKGADEATLTAVLGRFLDWINDAKRQFRQAAIFASTYGTTPPADHKELVGMILNVPMVRAANAGTVAQGLGLAGNKEDVPRDVADGLAIEEEEVDEIHFKVNADRQFAEAKAKLGR